MKRKLSGFFAGKSRAVIKALKIFLACIAIANLIWLFLFNYGYSDLPPSAQAEFPETAYLLEESESSTSSSEDERSSETGDTQKSTARKEGPDHSAETASSSNQEYEGPVIYLSEEISQISQSDLPQLVSRLSDRELLSAEDGYGNDITSSVAVSYKADPENTGNLLVKFSVTNKRGDFASEEISVPVHLTKPLLVLTKSSVTLNHGDSFNSIHYIRTALDQDGSSLADSVIVTGEVDTSKSGTYQLTYTINSKIEKQSSASETLTVTVK